MNTLKAKNYLKKQSRLYPGGVNSPVRAFKSVGGNPLFIKRGEGSKIYDVDGNEFIEYIGELGSTFVRS